MSWVRRSDEPAKLNVTDDPGFCFWNIVPIFVNVAVKDAAANTVNVLSAAADELAAGLLEDDAVVLLELQLTTSRATDSPATAATTSRSPVVEQRRLTKNRLEFR